MIQFKRWGGDVACVHASFVEGRWVAVRLVTTGSASRAVAKALRMSRAAADSWLVVMGEGLWKGSVRSEMEASLVDSVGQIQGERRPIFGRFTRLLPPCLKL